MKKLKFYEEIEIMKKLYIFEQILFLVKFQPKGTFWQRVRDQNAEKSPQGEEGQGEEFALIEHAAKLQLK